MKSQEHRLKDAADALANEYHGWSKGRVEHLARVALKAADTPRWPSPKCVEKALKAFRLGPPGVVRKVQQIDSYPGEHFGDPDAYNVVPTTVADELQAIRDVIAAALEDDSIILAAVAYEEACTSGDIVEIRSTGLAVRAAVKKAGLS